MDNNLKIPELELKILQNLWKHNNRASVGQIIDTWEQEPVPGYTTVLKKLQIMEQKELVEHMKAGRAFDYIPKVSKDEVSKSKLDNMLNSMFQGNRLEMVGAFFADAELSADELLEIRKMLDEKGLKDA